MTLSKTSEKQTSVTKRFMLQNVKLLEEINVLI